MASACSDSMASTSARLMPSATRSASDKWPLELGGEGTGCCAAEAEAGAVWCMGAKLGGGEVKEAEAKLAAS